MQIDEEGFSMENKGKRKKPKVKNILKSLFAPADDPRETFEYSYERQRRLLEKVQKALSDIEQTRNMLERKVSKLLTTLPDTDEQAWDSIKNNREDLARLALERRHIAEVEIDLMRSQLKEIDLEEQRLSLIEHRITSQIESFHTRQEVLAAKYSATEAQVRVHEALSGLSEEIADLESSLLQTEHRTENLQQRALEIDQIIEQRLEKTISETAHERGRQDYSELKQSVDEKIRALREKLEVEE
jgi:phage shock protein A